MYGDDYENDNYEGSSIWSFFNTEVQDFMAGHWIVLVATVVAVGGIVYQVIK
ncbi:MAG: hypothetical protein QNJ97_17940 [Myxococcota bacterium]|nr:hypothetical protein [Myxococcota bacterium]